MAKGQGHPRDFHSHGDMAIVIGCTALFVLAVLLLPLRLSLGMGSAQVRTITVDNAYSPETVHVLVGRPVHLRFLRPNAYPCTETVIVKGLGIDRRLAAFGVTDVRFTPDRPGSFPMHCGMNHLKGELDVRDPLGPSAWWPVFF